MEEAPTNPPESRLANDASRAVGVEKRHNKRHWVIGIVYNNTELSTRDRLRNLGFEAYVPSQTEIRVWKNGRKIKAERIFFKNWVFLHVDEAERKEVVETPWVREYCKNSGRNRNSDCPVLVIPDYQMDKMQFMLYQAESPVEISDRPFKKGDEVRVTRGNLAGLTGVVVHDSDGKSTLIVELGILGIAKVHIDVADLAPVSK